MCRAVAGRAMAKRRMIWCAAWLERAGECVSRARGSGSKAVSFAGRQVHGRTRSSTSGHLSVTEALLPVPPGEDRAKDRARGRAKPRYGVPTGVLGIRPASTRRLTTSAGSSSRGELLVQRPRLHAPTTPTELRRRTLDAFDPATSSATLNSRTMFDFRA
ncbi:hypothetical protein MTO96_046282 [Rhipicephalus appendiculatus]